MKKIEPKKNKFFLVKIKNKIKKIKIVDLQEYKASILVDSLVFSVELNEIIFIIEVPCDLSTIYEISLTQNNKKIILGYFEEPMDAINSSSGLASDGGSCLISSIHI